MTTPTQFGRTRFGLYLALILLVAPVHLGCEGQSSPTAPSRTPAVSFVPAPADLDALSGGSSWSSGSGSSGSGSIRPRTEKYIDAAQGGIVTAGRHTVIIPPGALYQSTTIRVEDESADGFIKCELRPHGITFRTPVTLITRFSDVTDPSGYTMFWDAVSPVTGTDVWVNVGGQETADHTGVQVQLNHFSEYAPGKAGW